MNTNFFYSKKALTIVKVASFFALLLLLIANINILNSTNFFKRVKNNYYIFSFIENNCIIIITFFLLLKPQKFALIGIISLWYSIVIAFRSSDNMMCIPMFFLTFGTFLVRGLFSKYKKSKISIFICIYLYEILIPLHFGISDFIESTILKIAYSFVIILSYFFISEFHISKVLVDINTVHVLNLANFKGINRCDIDLLEKVLENKKYKEIASELRGNPGTIRNRLNKLYDILNVGDRTGFITRYYGYKIVYE